MSERTARCRQCGGTGRLSMVAYGTSTAIPVHSTCEAAYFGSTFVGSQQRGRWVRHPLLTWARSERPGIGYIRDNALTDGWGWMRRST